PPELSQSIGETTCFDLAIALSLGNLNEVLIYQLSQVMFCYLLRRFLVFSMMHPFLCNPQSNQSSNRNPKFKRE
ncbi:hypothetical protein A2U01_0093428, partial [Trifolium medium]|nr:hypothetical protein [Trifolium medium]